MAAKISREDPEQKSAGSRLPVTRNPFRLLVRLLLALGGWKLELELPPAPSYVIIGAPHTSNWDWVMMLLGKWATGLRVHWAGKHTLFRRPFGPLMRRLGGIPVDRTSSTNLVDQLVAAFASRPDFRLIIAPEGTRKPVDRWKSGFYYIALGAGVPIALGYFDLQRKAFGIGGWIVPTGNVAVDLERIRAFYRRKVSTAERFVHSIRFASSTRPQAHQ
ncbi:MAG: glycerol acyltransferase [Calditrichaeota bacterium]|nr:MAG: glycerol acyltransferase [Calditrichota bacterium]